LVRVAAVTPEQWLFLPSPDKIDDA